MRIISWNVNGVRAVHKKGALEPVLNLKPDVLLLQETKAREEQLSDDVRMARGYRSYWNSSQERAGYSGVAIYSATEPKDVQYGMGVHKYDTEGRSITAIYDGLAVVGVYFPNGGQGPHRLAYKLEYYEHFLAYIGGLQEKYGAVVWGGDVNTAHEEIDLARPKENQENTGFLPEERAWLDEVAAHGWIDTFRHFYPEKAGMYTYWDMKTRARDRNVGWRIDYLFASAHLAPRLKKATIHSTLLGSDHCPISVELDQQ
jgi:exodeoxyribonuclease-3